MSRTIAKASRVALGKDASKVQKYIMSGMIIVICPVQITCSIEWKFVFNKLWLNVNNINFQPQIFSNHSNIIYNKQKHFWGENDDG